MVGGVGEDDAPEAEAGEDDAPEAEAEPELATPTPRGLDEQGARRPSAGTEGEPDPQPPPEEDPIVVVPPADPAGEGAPRPSPAPPSLKSVARGVVATGWLKGPTSPAPAPSDEGAAPSSPKQSAVASTTVLPMSAVDFYRKYIQKHQEGFTKDSGDNEEILEGMKEIITNFMAEYIAHDDDLSPFQRKTAEIKGLILRQLMCDGGRMQDANGMDTLRDILFAAFQTPSWEWEAEGAGRLQQSGAPFNKREMWGDALKAIKQQFKDAAESGQTSFKDRARTSTKQGFAAVASAISGQELDSV